MICLHLSIQAFKDIAKGEQQASALENSLTSFEEKIDELLARVHEDQHLKSLATQSKDKSLDQSDAKEADNRDKTDK